MYNWVIYIHIAATFAFLISHGASANVSIKLRREQNVDRIRALLELSAESIKLLYISLVVMLLSGIVAGFMGHWWGRGWMWTSIVILIGISVWMYIRGSGYYSLLRKAAGMPYFEKSRQQPALPAQPIEQITPLLKSGRPFEITAIGVVGLAVVLWLMMFKPF